MILANVNIGSGPSAGDGDPLRNAFTIINNNFAVVTSNVNSLTNSVTSVAGRDGNVSLTYQDIIGLSSTTLPYTPANPLHWQGNVTSVSSALNQIASRLFAANI